MSIKYISQHYVQFLLLCYVILLADVNAPTCNFFSDSDWQLGTCEGTSYPAILVLSETPNDNLRVSEDEFDILDNIKLSTMKEGVQRA